MGGDSDLSLTVSGNTEYSKYSTEAQSTYATVTLKAPLYEPEEHTPIDLVLSLDVSGSMAGTKLELAKKSIQFIIKNLRSSDRLGLVVYDTDVLVKFDMTAMDAAGKQKTSAVVESLKAGTSTNLSGGLLQAMNLMNNRVNANVVGSVLLFTDGLANVGIQDTPSIVEALRSVFNPAGKYSVHTFGFGDDHKADLLKGLSEAGNGMYFYVKDVDEIPTSFADCLGGLLSTVAQTIEVKLEAVNDCCVSNVHTSKPFKFSGNKICTVSLGDIQSEEEKDILFEISMPSVEMAAAEAVPAVLVTVTYFSCPVKQQLQVVENLALYRVHDVAGRESSLKVQRQKFRITTTAAMKEAKLQAEKGNLEAAKATLEKEMAQLGLFEDSYAKELLDDVKQCHSGMVDRISYTNFGSKYVESCWQTHSHQRSNVSSHSRGYVSYATNMKTKMKANMMKSAFEEGEDSS